MTTLAVRAAVLLWDGGWVPVSVARLSETTKSY